MRILIFILILVSNFNILSQTDTIYTIQNFNIPCKVTHTTSSVVYYEKNSQISSLAAENIRFISYNGYRTLLSSDTVDVKDEFVFLKKNLDSYAKQKQLSGAFIIFGTLSLAGGSYMLATNNKYGYVPAAIGSFLTLAGMIGNIDSYKFLRRAGIGIKGNAVTYTIR